MPRTGALARSASRDPGGWIPAPDRGTRAFVSEDPRLDYPATRRNRDPILTVLREVLPARGTVLELAVKLEDGASVYFSGSIM